MDWQNRGTTCRRLTRGFMPPARAVRRAGGVSLYFTNTPIQGTAMDKGVPNRGRGCQEQRACN